MSPLSIYIHYPFCKAKCPYCDFNSHVRDGVDHENFLLAYEKELEFFAAKISPRQVTTIFFGGGTPSLMPIFLVEGILRKISQLWTLDENCEITLEANPTSFESSKFKALRDVGINRLSIGIQALNDADLKFLGREHSAKEAIATIEVAAKIFDNFSFDLIYARPKQSLESWQEELSRAINFGTKHLSLYQLTIEKGTKFYSQFARKEFAMPDENLAAEFYEMTNQITRSNGLELYLQSLQRTL
jgi:oxygen-independent coproporphyrinogen-3 oxidase